MSIETLNLKKAKKYRSTVYVDGKRVRSPLFKRVVEARIWEEKIKQGYESEAIPSFQEASEAWMQSHCRLHNKPATIKKNQILLGELLPIFGSRKLNQIKTKDIEAHLSLLLEKGLAKSSLQHRVALIKSVYNWHLKRGVSVLNPCLALNKLKGEVAPLSYWTASQAESFLAYSQAKYSQRQAWVDLLYRTALNTGMRWGEILGLDWLAIDLERRQICIRQSFDEKAGELQASTKGGSIRYVGINESLYWSLFKAKGQKTKGLVFANLAQKPLDRRNFRRRHFQPDIKGADVLQIRFHDLRHTYATTYMANAGNIYDLQKLLGHSSLTMTERYAHFSPEHATQRSNVVNLGGSLKVIKGGLEDKEKQAVG